MSRAFYRPVLWWAAAVAAAFALLHLTRLVLPHLPARSDAAWGGETMGTTYSIRLADARLARRELDALEVEIVTCLDAVNRQMSHYRPDSELSAFNGSTSTAPFRVSAPLATVARFAVELNRRSHGAFDPALGPLIDLWGFGPQGRTNAAPTQEQIDEAMSRAGVRHLFVTPGGELQKDIPDLRLNLSAVAKGFGADEVARVILSRGVTNALVEIGGEIVALGRNTGGRKWRVGVDAPDPGAAPGGNLEAVLEVSDVAVATSGDYRNFFRDASGHAYAHILNPITGRPVEHHLASVTVVASNCLTADGLSTTLFVLGAEEGLPWVQEAYPDAAALFIVREEGGFLRQIATSNFTAATGYTPPEPPKPGRGTRWDFTQVR